MKFLVVNGPNLNMLGVREPDIYGKGSYRDLVAYIKREAKSRGIRVKCFQSNSEGRIITELQRARGKFDAVIINAGGYTHTGVAILDALRAIDLPTAEVHISDINSREEFRHFSYISLYACVFIAGKGFEGYCEAMDKLTEKITGKIPERSN